LGGLLFVSDDLSRTERLARDVDPARP